MTDQKTEIGVEIGSVVKTAEKRGNPNRKQYFYDSMAEDLVTLSHEEILEKWSRRFASLEAQRYEDPMTGLKVKEAGVKLLQKDIETAKEKTGNLSLLMIDLDGFKKANDTMGHAAGDKAIMLLADYLYAKTSRETIACRYGGDEFFLIMPGSPPDAAIGLSERAIEEISELMRNNGFDITISIGISYLRDDTTDADGMMKEADDALYGAKEKGKNRFEVYLPDELK